MPPPSWLLLFDIDGTMLLTGGAGMRAMRTASRELLGEQFSWDGIETSGGIDPVLFREAARHSRLEVTEQDHEAFRARYFSLLPGEIEASREQVRVMPGIHDTLAALRARAEIALGLLTGNYPEAAFLKLRSVRIDPTWFSINVFGVDGDTHPRLGQVAVERLRMVLDVDLPRERIVMIGDTPKDVHCARENGFVAVAVGTGKFTPDELSRAGAHIALRDLSDASQLWRLLDGA